MIWSRPGPAQDTSRRPARGFIVVCLLAGTVALTSTYGRGGAQTPGMSNRIHLPVTWKSRVSTPVTRPPRTPPPPTPTSNRAPSPTPARGLAVEREPIFQSGGAAHALAARGDYVYLGVGPRIRVLDVTDVARPTVVAETGLLGGLVAEIVLDDGFDWAYVAATSGGTYILDLDDPEHPAQLAWLPPRDSSYGVAFTNGVLYVADGRAGLTVWDVTDPTRPVQSAAIELPGSATAVAMSDPNLVVAGMDGGLHVFNARPTWEPKLVATYQLDPRSPAAIVDVAAWRGQAFALDEAHRLLTFDLQYSSFPSMVDSLPHGACCGHDLVEADGVLYLVWDDEVFVLRPRPGEGPEIVGRAGPDLGADDAIAVDTDRLFLAGDRGLLILALDGVSPGAVLGELALGRAGGRIAVSGDRLYANGGTFDVADPSAPRRFPEPAPTLESILAALGSQVITADAKLERPGAQLLRLEDPSRPQLMAELSPAVRPYAAAVGHGFAVVGGGTDVVGGGRDCPALDVIDISSPTSPITRLSLRSPALGTRNPHSVTISGHYAYVGLGMEGCGGFGTWPPTGLLVVDLEDPARGGPIPQLQLDLDVSGIALRGDYAYLAAHDITGNAKGSIYVVDISEPMRPTLAGRWEAPGSMWAIAADSGGVYASVAPSPREHWTELYVLDATDPSRLVERGRFAVGAADWIAVERGVLWTSSAATGLWAWRTTGSSSLATRRGARLDAGRRGPTARSREDG